MQAEDTAGAKVLRLKAQEGEGSQGWSGAEWGCGRWAAVPSTGGGPERSPAPGPPSPAGTLWLPPAGTPAPGESSLRAGQPGAPGSQVTGVNWPLWKPGEGPFRVTTLGSPWAAESPSQEAPQAGPDFLPTRVHPGCLVRQPCRGRLIVPGFQGPEDRPPSQGQLCGAGDCGPKREALDPRAS